MGMFDNISIGTKYGSVSMAGGKVSLQTSMDTQRGIVPSTPTPLQPVGMIDSGGLMGWVRSHTVAAAAIGIGLVVGLFLILRR